MTTGRINQVTILWTDVRGLQGRAISQPPFASVATLGSTQVGGPRRAGILGDASRADQAQPVDTTTPDCPISSSSPATDLETAHRSDGVST